MRYLTVMTVRVSAFVDGIQNSKAKAKLKSGDTPVALELLEETRDRPAELQALGESAGRGQGGSQRAAPDGARLLWGGHRAGLRRRTEGGTYVGTHRGRR